LKKIFPVENNPQGFFKTLEMSVEIFTLAITLALVAFPPIDSSLIDSNVLSFKADLIFCELSPRQFNRFA
jgi:hypothetical protein